MTNIQAIILGITEGLTEFLPISSTGHLTLASHFMQIIQNDQFVVFQIAIQLGAILAVVIFYWRKFLDISLLTKLFLAFLPTGIIGLLIYKYIRTLLSSELIVAFTLILGGVILILVEQFYKKTKSENHSSNISLRHAILLGFAQCVAMIPGVSRSGAIIVAGLLMKINRSVLVEFTFLLAVPTMSAATLYAIYKNKDIISTDYFTTISIGFITSFIVSIVVIKFLINYIKKYDFIPFGIYRIILGTIVLLTFLQ